MATAEVTFQALSDNEAPHPYVANRIKEARVAIERIDDQEICFAHLIELAKLAHTIKQPTADVRELLEAARTITDTDGTPSVEVNDMRNLAQAAHETDQSHAYTQELLEQGLRAAFRESDASKTIAQIRNLLQTSAKIEHSDRATTLLKPGIDFIRRESKSPRERHMLLNRLLRNISLTDEELATNNIRTRPTTRSFTFTN